MVYADNKLKEGLDNMAKKQNTIINEILWALFDGLNSLPRPFESPYKWIKRAGGMSYRGYYKSVHNLKKRGVVKIFQKNGEKLIQLTAKGQIEALLAKAVTPVKQKWDGKWRLILFDIPESSRDKRDLIRWILKKNNFIKLQASVFISPYAIRREAIEYLKKTKLIDYIRILRSDELDFDRDLRKFFHL